MVCCREAKAVLVCLFIHVIVVVKVICFKWAAPAGLEEVQMLLLITSTAVGFVLSLSCVHKEGGWNKLIGASGLTWFGVLLAWVLLVSFVL